MLKKTKLTEAPHTSARYYEVLFYLFIKNIYKKFGSTTATLNLISVLGELCGCNTIILNRYISFILHDDYNFCPSYQECVQILYAADKPIAYIKAMLEISNAKVYNVINGKVNYIKESNINEREQETLKHFLVMFDTLKGVV